MSGAKTSRPRLDAMLADLRRGDTVVVYSLSRLSRGTTHLMELSERFEHDGITLVSRTEQIDTSTAMGRFFYTVLAAQAAMERELLIERTRAGLEAARAAGTLWRPAGEADRRSEAARGASAKRWHRRRRDREVARRVASHGVPRPG